jgi:hypothetical protein
MHAICQFNLKNYFQTQVAATSILPEIDEDP